MPIYETLCVLHPELPETRVKEIIAWMQKILEGAQGSVLQMDQWGMRDLAFRAKKQRRGYYLRVECDAQPTALREFERNLRLSEDVLRFMSTVRSAPTATQAPAQP
ncbi:MAG: 30S ribosomal protein S6, partial [Candidatus Binatia bacterium]